MRRLTWAAALKRNCHTTPDKLSLAMADFKKVLEIAPKNKIAAENLTFFEAWTNRTPQRDEMLVKFCKDYPNSVRKTFRTVPALLQCR